MLEKKLLLYLDGNQWWPLPDGTRVITTPDGGKQISPEYVAGIIGSIMLQPELKPPALPHRPSTETKFFLVTPTPSNQFPTEGEELTYEMITRSLG